MPAPPVFPEVPDDEDERERRNVGGSLREYIRYSSLGMQFIGTMAAGVILGWFVDREAGTTPWFLLVGSMSGLGVALWQAAREVMKR